MNYLDRLERNIKLAYIFKFLVGLVFVIPIWVGFSRRVLNFSQIAFLSSLSFGLVTILELPTGALADLIGRKKTIILGWFLTALANIYVGFADSYLNFLVGEVLFAFGSALVSGSNKALYFDSLKELGRADTFSTFMARSGFVHRVGLALGSLLGGYLYSIWIGLPYLLQGVIRLFSIVLLLMMIEPKIDTEKFSLQAYLRQTKDGFKQLFQSPYMIKLSIFYTLVGGISWSVLFYFSQPFAIDVGFTPIEQSWLFGSIYLLTSALLLFLTSHDQILTRNRVYLGFPILMVVAFLPGYWAGKFIAPILLFFAQFVGSARFAVLDRYTNKEFLSKYRATAISALNMLVSIFYIIVVGVSGRIQDLYSTQLIFTLLGITTLFLVLPSSYSLVLEYKKYLQHKKKNK
jgi:MFS family permease